MSLRISSLLLLTVAGSLAVFFTDMIGQPAHATEVASNPSSVHRQRIVLGIVRSPENTAQWHNITARLEAAGLEHQAIDIAQIRQVSDLSNFTVLFLPSVEMISAEQAAALELWVNRGGRIIASGPVGNLAEADVRQRLRSLLGAYWAFPLAQPAALKIANDPAYAWVRSGVPSDSVWGGVVLPTNAMSQVVATWQNSQNSQQPLEANLFSDERAAAIVVNERVIFLGWRWGMSSAQTLDFDSRWLQAAVSQHGMSPVAATPAPAAAEAPPAPSPTAASPARPPSPAARPQAPTPAPASGRQTPIETAPRSQPRFRLQPPSSSPTPSATSATSATSSAPTADPAEQVAPPGLEVTPSSLPINTYDALMMRQELENLIGRYESALLAARTLRSDITLRTEAPEEEILAASATTTGLEGTRNTALPPALQQAQELLRNWSTLIEGGDHGQVRRQWLDARQALWDNFPTDQQFAQPEIRAVWLDRGTIVQARSRAGLTRIFDRLAEAGVNTVFFETVNAGYPIYPSRVAPQQNPLTTSWDPLREAVDLAHERGIELHAWVWIFAAGNQAHNQLLNQPASYPGPLISANPNWANYDNRGQMIPIGQGKPFLDPANPEVRSYLLRLLGEIAENYNVDGVQFDYIRYPFQDPAANRTYGYGLAARQQFQRLTGIDPVSLSPRDNPNASPEERSRQRRLWQQWTDFRIEQVNSFVAEASQMLKRRRPNLIVSAAVFPHSEHERRQKLQQQWETWTQRGDVDLIVLMSYAQDTNRFERMTRPWLVEANLGPSLILSGIRLLNLPNEIALDQIQTLRDAPTSGYALFAAENLNENLHGILRRTQGNPPQGRSEPVPYRQPFQTASARYAALMREWSWLLADGQLWINAPSQEAWVSEVEELEQALATLAENPSARHLERARSRLNRLRSNFNNQVRVSSVNGRYRVRAWDNRLGTLTNLLNYGERTLLQGASQAAERSSNPSTNPGL